MTLTRLLLVAGLLAVSACNGSSSDEPEETAPVPTAPPTNAATTTAPESTTQPASTSTAPTGDTSTTPADSTTSTTAVPPATSDLPEDLGRRLDSVPGVDSPGEIIELVEMVTVFVPSEDDPDDVNVSVPAENDFEIIVAYARAMTALYEQVTSNPIPVEPSEAMRSTFLDGGQKYSENVFAPRNAAGQHLAFFADNDVLRPVVLADPRSVDEAFIFDCAISGSRYVNADGSLADADVPGSQLAPLLIRLVRVDGSWIVDDIQDDDRACR
ncbi:MAG: hypothetical protein AAGG08_07890 [Actinomycetota bacterium]